MGGLTVMYEIDKQKFGAFVASLRKEKGLTQKELAQQFFISDKAVSKWETGVSIPDTALLIPIADLFGITVTELLMCQRMEQANEMDSELAESVVKTAISYPEQKPVRVYQVRNKWGRIYVLSLIVCCIELIVSLLQGYATTGLFLITGLSIMFGAYYCFLAIMKLPSYYDENRICVYSDMWFEMSFPGLAFNNRNWQHILNTGRIWAIVSMTVYPLVNALLVYFFSEMWLLEFIFVLPVTLGGIFIPVYVVGKKYE